MITENQILEYLEGRCTLDQAAVVEAWINVNASNKKHFEGLKKVHFASSSIADYKEIDVNKEWKTFQSSIEAVAESEQENSKIVSLGNKQPNNFMKYAVAASLAIILGAVLTFSNLFESSVSQEDVVTTSEQQTVRTKSQVKTVTLSDQSIVSLSEYSELQFPSSFINAESREVNLISGSANFKVTHDPSKKFRLKCNDVIIEVLGTEFQVSINDIEEEIRIDLISGSVKAFQNNNVNNNVILKSGDKISYKNDVFSRTIPIVALEETNELKPLTTSEDQSPTLLFDVNQSTFRLGDALEYIDEKFGDKLILQKKLKYNKSQTIQIDINQSELNDIIADLERLTSLTVIEGDCVGCYIITSDNK